VNRVEYTLEAELDILEAARWYEAQRPELSKEFLDAVAQSEQLVRSNPNSYQVAALDVRRALVKRFPYGPFFVLRGDRIVILACFHAKRDPKTWINRRFSSEIV